MFCAVKIDIQLILPLLLLSVLRADSAHNHRDHFTGEVTHSQSPQKFLHKASWQNSFHHQLDSYQYTNPLMRSDSFDLDEYYDQPNFKPQTYSPSQKSNHHHKKHHHHHNGDKHPHHKHHKQQYHQLEIDDKETLKHKQKNFHSNHHHKDRKHSKNDMKHFTARLSTRPAVRLDGFGKDSDIRNDDADMLPMNTAPTFDESVTAEVLAEVGAQAFLPCRIINLGDKSVSWIRNQDSHILTVDRYTFISDQRFTAHFEAATQTWYLQIKYLTDEDQGLYECQLSTEPKMSRSINLQIVHPVVTISGGSELHVRSGSNVTIKCVIARAIQPVHYVFWYHGGSIVKSSETGQIPLDDQLTAPGSVARQTPVERVNGDTAFSALTIRGVTRAHAGNYTCSPAGLPQAFVTLHVLNGEHPAAMQHGTKSTSTSISTTSASSTKLVPLSYGLLGALIVPLVSMILSTTHLHFLPVPL